MNPGRALTNASAIGATQPRQFLVIACNDPTGETGLGTRLRTTIDGLATAGSVDVVAFGGGDLHAAAPAVQSFFKDRVRHYERRPRVPRRTSLLGYVRWLGQRSLPRSLFFGDYERERDSILEQLRWSYDIVWCASPRAFLVLGCVHDGVVVTDLSQYVDLDVELLGDGLEIQTRRVRMLGAMRRAIARVDRRRWHRLYRTICRESTVTTICSRVDRDRVGDPSIVIVPNAYPEPPARATVNSEPTSPTILFTGFFPYAPNADAAIALATRILPRVRARIPEAQVRLVGKPTPRVERLGELPGVTVTGFVPAVADELRRADLVAAPLRVVAGTNMKVLEAFAYGIPVVASSAAARGLELEDGRELLIRDDAQEFADACVAILTNRELAHSLVGCATERYRSEYSTHVARDRIAAIAAVCAAQV